MARGRKPATVRMNDMDKETIAKNFLEEQPENLPVEKKVVVAKEVPPYEKIIFFNNRDPGVTLHFHYASGTHPLKHYDLVHGVQYDLPSEIIHHLEGENAYDMYACHSRLYSQRKNLEGLPENYVSGYKSYFQCKRVRA